MKKILFSFIGILLLFSCKTKSIENIQIRNNVKELNYIPYYLTMYKADSLFLVNDFDGSYKKLDSLFKIYPPLNSDNYVEYGEYLNSAVMSGHTEDINKKVKYGYLHFGGITTLHKKSFEMMQATNKAANLNQDEIKELKLQYYNNLNLDLRKEMLDMFNEDQNVRIENKGVAEMNSIDEKNRQKLNQIFKAYGFPRKNLIGSNNAYDVPDGGTISLNIFFMHQPDSVRAKYLPVLFDAVKKGYCEPDIYSVVYDRDLILRNKKQRYGTYTCPNGEMCPLENPKKIDSLRKDIGLPPIKYYPWKIRQIQE